MTKTNKQKGWEKRFDERFYVFDKAHGYEVQFKGGSFTGSSNAYNFGKKLKQFISDELSKQKEDIIKKLEEASHQESTMGGLTEDVVDLDQAINIVKRA